MKFCLEKLLQSYFSKPKSEISQIFNNVLNRVNLTQYGVTEQCETQVISFLNSTLSIDFANIKSPDDAWPILG